MRFLPSVEMTGSINTPQCVNEPFYDFQQLAGFFWRVEWLWDLEFKGPIGRHILPPLSLPDSRRLPTACKLAGEKLFCKC
jgi:hypothetical protein